ncbi:MAG TPA: bifunctional hydroxymethylpyrimidine kinase/phosphomethylpyrimidine kinase [Methanocorpusculum sp.]|nr:bifunctional hydroxymethylpyrimidine kinase/phosphomethylpyrimidine kinase [Methanocorpusculum sp.]
MSSLENTKAFAATIAGSDPSAGAGIQVDLKTMAACGVWGMTVIAALTAQNATHVLDTASIPAEFIRKQIGALEEDFPIGCYKTGMLKNAETVKIVAESIPDGRNIVVDPVLLATKEYRLLDLAGQEKLTAELLPRTTVITPNLPEAAALSGITIADAESMEEAAYWFIDQGAQAAVIKGGHAHFRLGTDVFADKNGMMLVEGEVAPFTDVHGSGCCYASAIAAHIALGFPVREAVCEAKKFVSGAIKYSWEYAPGRRTMNPGWQQYKTYDKKI